MTLAAALEELDNAIARSCIDLHDLHAVTSKVAAKYAYLSFQLSPTEAWRWGKLSDAAVAARYCRRLTITHRTSELLATALECIAFSADIGRLILRNQQIHYGLEVDQLTHGSVSAEYLRRSAKTIADDDFGEMLLTAVSVHSHRENPTLQTVSGCPCTLALCQLLRDLDRLGNWLSGDEYLQRWKMDAEMAIWGFTEAPYIPEPTTAAFLRSEPVDRASAETYAGYMLQFLSWGYQFSYKELWKEAVATGNPRFVLEYVRDQLLAGGHSSMWQQIKEHAEQTLGITTA